MARLVRPPDLNPVQHEDGSVSMGAERWNGPVNGRFKTELPIGRIQVGWRNGRAIWADIYPSDISFKLKLKKGIADPAGS